MHEFSKNSPSQLDNSLWIHVQSPRQFLNINDNSEHVDLIQPPAEGAAAKGVGLVIQSQIPMTLPMAYPQNISKTLGYRPSFAESSNVSLGSVITDDVSTANRTLMLDDGVANLSPRTATTLPSLTTRPSALTHFIHGL
jgi:hypothetical protein